MKKIVLWSSVLLLFLLTACSQEQGAITPSTPQKESATDEGTRIIAGTVVIAELLDRLNLDAIAIPETTKKLPTRFDGLPTIGNAMEPDMEIVKSLAPTDVLSVSTLEYDLTDKFQQLAIPAHFLNFQSIDSLLEETVKLGERYNRKAEAQQVTDDLHAQLASVKPVENAPKVLILLGIPGSYLVATEHSYVGDLVKRAGGENVMAGQTVEYLPSNTEYLHESNPDIILRLAHGMPAEVVEMFNEEFKTNTIWKHFSAVKTGKVYDLEEELFGTTASLQAPEALNQLTKLLQQ